jgi:hypothetical protein
VVAVSFEEVMASAVTGGPPVREATYELHHVIAP